MLKQIIYRNKFTFWKKDLLIHLILNQGQGGKVYRWKLSVIEDLLCTRILTVIILFNPCVALCYNVLKSLFNKKEN